MCLCLFRRRPPSSPLPTYLKELCQSISVARERKIAAIKILFPSLPSSSGPLILLFSLFPSREKTQWGERGAGCAFYAVFNTFFLSPCPEHGLPAPRLDVVFHLKRSLSHSPAREGATFNKGRKNNHHQRRTPLMVVFGLFGMQDERGERREKIELGEHPPANRFEYSTVPPREDGSPSFSRSLCFMFCLCCSLPIVPNIAPPVSFDIQSETSFPCLLPLPLILSSSPT